MAKVAMGRPRKSLADHVRDGTYRRDRHGPLPGESGHAGEQGEASRGPTGSMPNVRAGAKGTKEANAAGKHAVTSTDSAASESQLRDELANLLGETLTDRDSHMLGELCWWWTVLRKIQTELNGMIPGQKGYRDTLASAGAAIDKVVKIGEKFGLTPADRSRLGVVSTGPVVAKSPVKPKTKLDQQGPPKKEK